MKEKIIEILKEIDEDIVDFAGQDLLDEGIIDSFTIIEILTELEETLNIKILPEDVIQDNFKTVESICAFVMNYKEVEMGEEN